MLRVMSDKEVNEYAERVRFLRASPYIQDQIAGILMDTNIGSTSMYEPAAQAKAHAIISQMEFQKQQKELKATETFNAQAQATQSQGAQP